MACTWNLKIAFLLLLAGTYPARSEDLTTLDQKTYRDIRVLQTNAFAIRITYPGGGGWVSFTNLPAEVQRKYGYDAPRAEALARKQEKIKKLGRLGACYRLSELTEAQAEARRDGKPLAFLATFTKNIQGEADMLKKGSTAASIHAFEALKQSAVLVFSDSDTENHQEPPIVDAALHNPPGPYSAPKVVITDAEISQVIFVIPYNEDGTARQKLMVEALGKIKAARK
jgi:hypothetical protein